MNRPWQIWLTFIAALAVLIGAVGWLSIKAIQSEAAEIAANRQAKLDEIASLALWRMDSFMTPLVAQESARPYFMYNAFYSNERVGGRAGKGKSIAEFQIPSPLLTETTPNVLLHFQCDPQQQVTSPECPTGKTQKQAEEYLSEDQLIDNGKVLAGLRKTLNLPQLLAQLPPPEPATAMPALAGNPITSSPLFGSPPGGANPSQPSQNFADNGQNAQLNPAPSNSNSQVQQPGQQQVQQALNYDAQSKVPNQPPPFAQEQRGNGGQLDLQARVKSLAQSSTALQNSSNYDFNNDGSASTSDVQMSMMRALWLGSDLVLARRVNIGGRDYVQGCLLDWPALKQQMLNDAADLLPNANLKPVATEGEAVDVWRLASLPVMLIPGTLPTDEATVGGLSPIRQALLVAWGAMALAAVAVAVLLRGVIALSERRGAFVSAVTHELRTPLTTFRMYAEMLSEGMVREESDRRHYLETLRVEADRLTHLVANVLAYARLERGRPGGRIETVSVQRLLEVATQRLADRAAQAQLQLSIEPADGVLTRGVRGDPAAVEQILFNLVDNACKYASTAVDRTLHLSVSALDGQVCIRLRDHGSGVPMGEERRLFRPFHKSARDAAHSAPGVGLGLALSKRLARDMQGDLRYEQAAEGACFALTLPAAT